MYTTVWVIMFMIVLGDLCRVNKGVSAEPAVIHSESQSKASPDSQSTSRSIAVTAEPPSKTLNSSLANSSTSIQVAAYVI